MPRLSPLHILAIALSAVAANAQITATYASYGAGCPGTGIGLGAGHILPATAATTFGSGNAIPFGWSPNKYQQVFAGTDLPIACTLAAMRFRNANQNLYAPTFVVDMEIKVGYTTKPVGGLDTTFANNWDSGAPVTVLPRAQMTFPDHVQPASPAEFNVGIPWTATLAWTPTPGLNLLVEYTVYGNSLGGGIYGYPTDQVSNTSSMWGTPATATTGQLRSFAPAVQFIQQSNTAVPMLYSIETPQIGNTFPVRLSQCHPSTAAVMLLGLSNSMYHGAALPLSLGGFGAPGCSLLASGDSMALATINSSGNGTVTYTLPNNIYLLNLHIYNQAMVLDPAANALGLAFTNGGVGLLGNQ